MSEPMNLDFEAPNRPEKTNKRTVLLISSGRRQVVAYDSAESPLVIHDWTAAHAVIVASVCAEAGEWSNDGVAAFREYFNYSPYAGGWVRDDHDRGSG